METPRYTTRFEIKAKVVLPEKNQMQEIQASISSLKSVFPRDLNPKEDRDLLYIAGNLAVANQVNKNGDCISGETLLKVYKKFEKKFIDLDHDRNKIHGYIVVTGLSSYETGELITEEQAASTDGFFNVVIGGIIWRAVNNKLAEYLVAASDEDGDKFGNLSFSLEVGFNSYSIAVGQADLRNAIIYDAENNPTEFAKYEKYLVANGGKGSDKDGNLVYRTVDDGVIPLGAGIVVSPAADVEGITTLLEIQADDDIDEEMEVSDEFMAKLQDIIKQVVLDTIEKEKRPGGSLLGPGSLTQEQLEAGIKETNEILFPVVEPVLEPILEPELEAPISTTELTVSIDQALASTTTNKIVLDVSGITASTQYLTEELKNNSQLKINSVNQTIPNMTKITTAEDIVTSWSELVKHEASASAITKFIADEIARKSESYIADLQAKETAATELKAKTDKALADVELLRSELDTIKQEKTAKEIQAKFDERMTGFDNEYDLADEDRQIIAQDIKALSDESFASYCEKFKVLSKEKSKAFKTLKASNIAQELEKKGFKATVDKDLNFSEILASAKEEPVTIPVGPSGVLEETLSQKMAKAFGGDGITINGKPRKTKE